jgi:peptidoglycan biosynthesis protein MviN/MurJ (putative lipid II flippase)
MALSAALIPPFGAMGAALATLGGYAFMAAATWRTAQPVFPVEYEWGRVFGLVSLAAGLWLASLLVPLGGWSIPMKAGLWLLWPLLAWVFRLVSPDEKAYVRSSVSQVLSWLRPRLRQAESSSSGTGALVPEVGS